MSRRTKLHEDLVEVLGNPHVYFQPPPTLLMEYPCIRYELDAKDVRYSNDRPYLVFDRYSVVIMDFDPDSELVNRMMELPYCRFNRKYKADQLCHYVFDCYVTKE